VSYQFKYWLILLFSIVSLNIFGQAKPIRPKVSVANFGEDSMRVFVNKIQADPILRICNSKENLKIISYQVVLNINGIIYAWWQFNNDTLEKEKIQKMIEVHDSLQEYNQLIIKNVLYQKPDKSIDTANELYIWLSNGTGCNGYYDIEKEYYRNGRMKFEYYYCNDTISKIKNYRKNGSLICIKDYYVSKDTIIITNFYRKDGSKIIHERLVNGQEDGDYYIYYRDGSYRLESENVKGIRIHERLFDKKGQLTQESTYDPSGNNGDLKYYDKSGKVKKEESTKFGGLKEKLVF